MTPLWHYREAEALLARAYPMQPGDPGRAEMLAAAQVHATLATCHMTSGVWSEDKP